MILKALIACEESQVVCKEFRALGHLAFSCDLQDCSGGHPEWHLKMDVFEAIKLQDWDIGIFHPPCQFMAVSGARWMYNKDGSINQERKENQEKALDFVRKLMDCCIPYTAIENPISIISSKIRKPDQVIHPWMHGHPEKKSTCLWLNNLPLLIPTNDVREEMKSLPKSQTDRIHYMSPGPERAKMRSKTFPGFAKAMASQWSQFVINKKRSIFNFTEWNDQTRKQFLESLNKADTRCT